MEPINTTITFMAHRREHVKAVFADTFYWIALSNSAETRYRDARWRLTLKMAGLLLLTTDEVLSEFLTFFAGDGWLRERAIAAVKGLARNRRVHWLIHAETRTQLLRLLSIVPHLAGLVQPSSGQARDLMTEIEAARGKRTG
jgi:hypothetical protein